MRRACLMIVLSACEMSRMSATSGSNTPGDPPELAREVVYSSDIAPTLWRADRNALPASGSYTFLSSHGTSGTSTRLYTDDNSLTRVTRGTATLSVSISGADPRAGTFVGTFTMTQLPVGYYTRRTGVPFTNPTAHGLFASPELDGCAAVDGWFALDSVGYANEAVTAVDLRFEQHCTDDSGTLNGQIHWRG